MIGTEVVDAVVTIEAGSILAVDVRADGLDPTELDEPGMTAIDGLLAPGFIDLQINGGFGIDLVTDPDGLWSLARRLPAHGVTGFLPTFISAEPDTYERAIEALAARPSDHVGAEPLGLHFEGPMLAPERRGAHPAGLLRAPDPGMYQRWTRERGVALVTLAPELDGALDAIETLTGAGVVVSAGHTTADATTAAAASSAGMAMVTHLFNAMAPLGHRTPNLVGHALTCPDLVVGLIVDGVHVDPTVVDLVGRAVEPARLVLVTDAVAAMGQPHGTYGLGPRRIVAGPDGVRRPDGTLAGSALTMPEALANMVDFAGWTPAQAISSATTTPAALLGDERRGSIEPGRRADLTVLDAELRPRACLVGGRPVHGRLTTTA